MQLRRELDEVAESAAGIDVELGLADVTALLRARLAGRPTRASFRTGTLTVCTLVPMRSVPHRVVCLLGMDDGAFPRQGVADGDDVLAREPRTGERDVRSEDRQLFLDAICAAQEHLVIAYTGADPRSGAEVPPCVPLGELLDAVDATARRARRWARPGSRRRSPPVAAVRPPQLPAGPAGNNRVVLLRSGRACGSSRRRPAAAAGAATRVGGARARPLRRNGGPRRSRCGSSSTRSAGSSGSGWTSAPPSSEDDPDDAITVELDGLQNWAIGDRVLRRCLAGTPRDTAAHLEYLRGELPPGPLGAQAMRAIGSRVDALLHASELERRDRGVVGRGNRPARGRAGPVRDGARRTGVDDPERHLFDPRPETSPHLLGAIPRDGRDAPRTPGGAPSPSGAAARQRAGRSFTGSNRRSRDSSSTCSSASATPGCASRCRSPSRHPRTYATRRERGTSVGDAAARRQQAVGGRPLRPRTGRTRARPGLRRRRAVHATHRRSPANPPRGFPGESTRFGALARLVWAPLLAAEVDVLP